MKNNKINNEKIDMFLKKYISTITDEASANAAEKSVIEEAERTGKKLNAKELIELKKKISAVLAEFILRDPKGVSLEPEVKLEININTNIVEKVIAATITESIAGYTCKDIEDEDYIYNKSIASKIGKLLAPLANDLKNVFAH